MIMYVCEATTSPRYPSCPQRVLKDSSLSCHPRSPSCCPRLPSSPLCCVCCWTPLLQSPNCPSCQSSSSLNYLPWSSCHCWEISSPLRSCCCQKFPRSPLTRAGWSCLGTPQWRPCSDSSLHQT